MRRVAILIGSVLFGNLGYVQAARLITKGRGLSLSDDPHDDLDAAVLEVLKDLESGGGSDDDGISEEAIQGAVSRFDASVFGDVPRSHRVEYDFRNSWDGLSFSERWEMFRNEVDVRLLQGFWNDKEDTGPVCHPALVGNKDSEKLAILTHGFLGCPGMWYRVVPKLISAGFQVMLVVLPGHGRRFEWTANGEVVDTGDFGANTSSKRLDSGKVNDNIDDLPTTAAPYLLFADALRRLAEQWKLEHPKGLLVAAGHSLGGAVTAKFAMEIPDVVDSVLLLSPMLGLKWKTIETFANLAPNVRLSKGASCEHKRGTGSGGMCQFRLSQVLAMADFAFAVLCCHWGFENACANRYNMGPNIVLKVLGIVATTITNLTHTMEVYKDNMRNSLCRKVSRTKEAHLKREGMGQLKSFQVVTSKGENLVDNGQIEEFVDEVRKRRVLQSWGESSHIKTDFCKWSSEVGHSYMSNRGSRNGEKWWHPYIENVVKEFLEDGKNFDIATRSAGGDYCFEGSDDVAGSYLVRLPATQQKIDYWIGYKGVRWPSRAKVLFQGEVVKESEWRRLRNARQVEILSYHSRYLIVTRLAPHENVRDIFQIRTGNLILLTREDGDCCMRPELHYVDSTVPLHEAVKNSSSSSTTLRFCGKGFLRVICKEIGCATDSLGTKATQSWLFKTCAEDMDTANNDGEDHVKKVRLRGDVVVQVSDKRGEVQGF